MSLPRWFVACLAVLALLETLPAAETAKIDPLDWPVWRGPEMNGISRETGLVDSLDPKSPDVAWKNVEAGSRSTPIVMNGKLYTLCRAEPGTTREGEKVICLDAATGKKLWENRFNVYSSTVPDTRVAWSSVVGDPATGHVYALGVCDLFTCMDGETGKTLWQIPLAERFGMLNTYGGRTNFPVVCDNLVIVSGVITGWGDQARPAHRFLGFDKMTGEVVWFTSTRPLPEDTTYSSPSLAVLGGQKALVFGGGDGLLWAFQPRTGQAIWNFQLSKRGMDISPVVVGDTVYMSHSEENLDAEGGSGMGAAIAINAVGKGDITKSNVLWKQKGFTASKSSPLVVDGRVYQVDDSAKLQTFDFKTGEPIGRKQTLGTAMRASLMYAEGKIYAIESNGRWFIFTPDEKEGVKKTAGGRLPQGEEVHATPIVSHGRLYLNTTGGIYCYVAKDKKPGTAAAPEPAKEADVSADQTPAHAQVVPCEVLMKPGEKQKFTVRLFNAHGQFLKDSPATFTVEGPAKVTDDGTLTAEEKAGHAGVFVTAKVGELTGKARVRVIPPLPWSFDFEDTKVNPTTKSGEPPVTWVGARYRHVVRDIDGNKKMVKITTIPKGTRSRASFGPDDLSNYTLEAEVMADIKDNKMPDIAIVAQGYTLVLHGEHQDLQCFGWDAQLEQRMAKTIPFTWKPKTPYMMKLQVELVDGKAHVRGKSWLKSEQEPTAWMVEGVDDMPTLHGAPGLYADSTNAEIFLDNIKVYANK